MSGNLRNWGEKGPPHCLWGLPLVSPWKAGTFQPDDFKNSVPLMEAKQGMHGCHHCMRPQGQNCMRLTDLVVPSVLLSTASLCEKILADAFCWVPLCTQESVLPPRQTRAAWRATGAFFLGTEIPHGIASSVLFHQVTTC